MSKSISSQHLDGIMGAHGRPWLWLILVAALTGCATPDEGGSYLIRRWPMHVPKVAAMPIVVPGGAGEYEAGEQICDIESILDEEPTSTRPSRQYYGCWVSRLEARGLGCCVVRVTAWVWVCASSAAQAEADLRVLWPTADRVECRPEGFDKPPPEPLPDVARPIPFVRGENDDLRRN